MKRLLASCLLLSWACAQPPSPTRADEVPEQGYSGQSLREAFDHEGSFLESPQLATPAGATVVALALDLSRTDAAPWIQARGIDELGRPGPWLDTEVTWAEGRLRVARVELETVAAEVQVRILETQASEIDVLRFQGVVPEAPLETPRPNTGELRRGLSSSLAAAGVVSRADWGARPSACAMTPDPDKNQITIHHTVTPLMPVDGDYAPRVRQVQSLHLDGRGWCDVGYHFLVTGDGTVWEGREAQFRGAHVAAANDHNVGVAFIGCFEPGDATCDLAEYQPNTPPEVMVQNAGEFLSALVAEYSIIVTPETVYGHRDHPSAATACPGTTLHDRIEELRTAAGQGMPSPGTVRGIVFDRSITDGPSDPGVQPITGATVQCSCGQSAQVSASDASWSLSLPAGQYEITASAPGYQSASVAVDVTAGIENWSSIGLLPESVPNTDVDLVVRVFDAASSLALTGASVQANDLAAVLTDTQGQAQLVVPAGDTTIRVTLDGYEEAVLTQALTAGSATVDVGLTQKAKTEDPDPNTDPDIVAGFDDEADDGGCGCSATGSSTGFPKLFALLLVPVLFLRRRR